MSDIDILTQIERALVSDSQTQRDLAMDGAHVEIQRLRKENAILDKELVRHIRHASELISQVEEKNKENAHLSGVIDDAADDIERLETALRRLASPEAFVVSRVATEEETARMRFASDALKGSRHIG